MGAKELFDVAAEVTKELAKEVYKDGGTHVVKSTGELVGLVPRAIKAALLPLEKWILQKEYNVAEIKKLLEEKLKNIPPETIQSPEPYIAVPAMRYISYCMDNEDLRNMYANLLASSMQKDVKDDVHPADVEIIKQLCPDEAKILKYMSINNTVPVITIKFTFQNGESGMWETGLSIVAEKANCKYPGSVNRYFDNLKRLGLVNKSKNAWFLEKKRFDEVIEHDETKRWYEFYNNPLMSSVKCIKEAYEITSFCERFFAVCLYEPLENEEDGESQ